MRLLLDANLSPKTADYLRRSFSYDAISLLDEALGFINDPEVIAKAKKEDRVIITFDLDFGKLYHESGPDGSFGAIIVRTSDQRRKNVEFLLHKFFSSSDLQKTFTDNPNKLVILEDAFIRIS